MLSRLFFLYHHRALDHPRVLLSSSLHWIYLSMTSQHDKYHLFFLLIFDGNPTDFLSALRLHVTQMKSHPGMKNFCLHVSFIPEWNEWNFILGWNLIWKKTSHSVWKHIIKFIILAWYVKTSEYYFLEK